MSETIRIAGYLKLFWVVQNSYFKDDDFTDDPIKPYLKPYYLVTVFNQSQYYYMLLSQNKVTLNDNPVFSTPVEKTYVETRIDYQVN